MLQRIDSVYGLFRVLIVLTLVIGFVAMFWPFKIAILLAVFVAFGVEPIIQKVHSRMQWRKLFSVGLLFVILLLVLIPATLFVWRVRSGLDGMNSDSLMQSEFFQAIFGLWSKVQDSATDFMRDFGVQAKTVFPQKAEIVKKISEYLVTMTTFVASSLPEMLLSLFVFFCTLFVLVINAQGIHHFFVTANILPREEIEEVTEAFKSSCYKILVSTLLIGTLQTLVVAGGSSLFGYHEFFLIFSITFFLSFIPILGAPPVAVLLALIEFILGHSGYGFGMLAVAGVSSAIDHILKPMIFSSEDVSLNPVVALLGILGAIVVYGLPGLLLGPLLLQVTVKLAPFFMRKLFANHFSDLSSES